MRVDEFDFQLPEDRIALRPAVPRDSARLLVVRPGQGLQDLSVSRLPELLRAGDALVFNDTRVIPARLAGVRLRPEGDVRVEATLLKRTGPDRWTALMKPGRRLAAGDRLVFGAEAERACSLGRLEAVLESKGEGGEVEIRFALAAAALDEAVAALGRMPLPPYIATRRAEDERDFRDYQTVFARYDGSVAAPTAGLHFTPELLHRLTAMGVSSHFVTLHVGAGTFLPVKVEAVDGHRMHAEWGEVTEETAMALSAVRAAGGRVICVGTTSLRLLESATTAEGELQAFAGETDIFITPGYRFRLVDGLLTNFHLPKSTLFMLVAAFSGLSTMQAAYAHAIASGYRFYSYGDASLLYRAPG